MIEMAANPADPAPVDPAAQESALRDELARGDAVAETVLPILRHLIASESNSLFSDEVLARVRGMIVSLADELLETRAAAGDLSDPTMREALCAGLLEDSALLAHVHAVALEWQLTERLQRRIALDPVVPPLLQALVASPDAATQELAMHFLAAQSRFAQNQQRMMLPLRELPADSLHAALLTMRELAGNDDHAAHAEAAIRNSYDESTGRLGLASQLILGMGNGMVAALSILHAGTAIFLSALAISSCSSRDSAVLATQEAQQARLALALRAAGLKPGEIAAQIVTLHADDAQLPAVDCLSAERAAAILAAVQYHER